MPELADAFSGDIFSLVSLTKAINLLPRTPTRLGDMGIFREEGITTLTVMIEEKNGQIALVPETRRGAPGTVVKPEKRTARTISVGHIQTDDGIDADDVLGVRAFGSESTEEVIATKVNNRLQAMRSYLDVTREYRRARALQGQILDADGSTVLVDLFTEFGVSEQSVDFPFTTATTDVRGKIMAVKRALEDAVGNTAMIRNVRAICGPTWFDALTSHQNVKEAYANWSTNEMLRADLRDAFQFGGVLFEEYRYTVSGNKFIADDEARFFAEADIYGEYFAPADYMETVNTVGLPMYAKSEPRKMNKGVDLEAQTNPLPLCFLPASLIKGTQS